MKNRVSINICAAMNPKKNREPTLCSICIPTYQRPHLLKSLIMSLIDQELPPGVEVEVIVVDNDFHRSAAPVLQRFRDVAKINLHYFVQPQKNISLCRNLAVAKASGRYILFIDDDEFASSRWVSNHLNTIQKFQADGVFGPVMPTFNEKAPRWMRRRDLFYGPLQRTGERPFFPWSNNCIISASLLKTLKEPFDPSYGITGGEDTHLFERLEKNGAHFIYCREAWVFEYLPPQRTTISYLFLRSLKGGNGYTRRKIEFSEKSRTAFKFLMVLKAISYGGFSLVMSLFFFPSPVHQTRWIMKFGSNVGRFLASVGFHYKMYK